MEAAAKARSAYMARETLDPIEAKYHPEHKAWARPCGDGWFVT
jgi:hypothetical protein